MITVMQGDIAAVPVVSYAVLRRRWCAQALRRFLWRWGVYGLVLAAVIGAGGSGGGLAVVSVAAGSVLPLWHALASAPWTLGLAAWLVQAAVGWGLLRACRPLLWPAAWRENEAALPLDRQDILTSDLMMAAAALLPWGAVQALGAATLLAAAPAWLQPVRGQAVLALCAAQVAALVGGVWGLQSARGLRVGGVRAAELPHRAPGPRLQAVRLRSTHWIRVLLIWPLWRGPAMALGRAVAVGTFMLSVFTCGLLWRPDAVPWWVAGWSATALAWVSRWNTLARQGLSPLLAAATESLPLPAATLEAARRGLCLAAVSPMTGALLAALFVSLPAGALRTPVLLLWCGVLMPALWLATARPRTRTDDSAGATASLWLLSLVLLLALSSEIRR